MDCICTLYEKHYDYGVAGLCNSLSKSGFKGLIIIGYKLHLPFWLKQLKKADENNYYLDDNITLTFVCLDHIDYHLGYYKAKFLLYCLDHFQAIETLSYFDPDITIKANWSFFRKWIKAGVALASDNCYPFLHRNHPWRADWLTLFPERQAISYLQAYINSGFIGFHKKNKGLVELWDKALEAYLNNGGQIQSFERNAEEGLKGDQDLLNAALMFFPETELSIIGLEAMGFIQPCYIMGHAINGVKPWKRKFTADFLLNNISASFAEKLYLENCSYPIKVFPLFKQKLKMVDITIASALNRFL
ncbi:hypothetical protein [Pedobacter arcticus]|uniref:hypothetical protein n=1 Tax=Pedobacter arcticus TaxID=752140 RepID=UPI0003041785|nr:hypothetical protein [Pedobacter arcticus]